MKESHVFASSRSQTVIRSRCLWTLARTSRSFSRPRSPSAQPNSGATQSRALRAASPWAQSGVMSRQCSVLLARRTISCEPHFQIQEMPTPVMKSSRALAGMPYVCASCRRSLKTTRRQTFASATQRTPDIYDVVTVGGGPVGLALLAALSM
jgi:hypothetical protein